MTIATTAAPNERESPTPSRREAFRRAHRHSRGVKWVKRSILIFCFVAIALLVAISYFDPFRRLPRNLSVAATVLNGSRITMEHPRLSGYREDGRPYDLRAASGVQDVRTPNIVDLTDLDARVDTAEQAAIHLVAPRGVFDSSKDSIVLGGDIRITSDSGYDIRLKSADVNFKTGTVVSDDPVSVTLVSGAIAANSLRIADRGKRILFGGGVETILKPASGGPEDARP